MTPDSTIRLTTWNCCRTSYSKAIEAAGSLGAALTVLQEARQPKPVPTGHLWSGVNPRNGLGALPGPGYEVEALATDAEAPWSIVPLRLQGAVQINVLHVWTRKEHTYCVGLNAALTRYAHHLLAGPSVVLGDFNANAIWDDPGAMADFSRVAARLKDQFGLVSAYHTWFGEPFGKESRPTHYFWRQRARPFHIDYCFLPDTARLTGVAILDEPPFDALSDHRPLVVDLNL